MNEYRAALAGSPLPPPANVERAPVKAKKRSFVYFIAQGDLVKIGVSTDVKKRVYALTTSNPRALRLIRRIDGCRKVEAEMHKRFASLRVKGEWFSLSGELAEYLKQPSHDDSVGGVVM